MKLTQSIGSALTATRTSRFGIGLRTGAAVIGQIAVAPVALTGGAIAVMGLAVAAVGHLTYRGGETLAQAAVSTNERLQEVITTGKVEAAHAKKAAAQRRMEREIVRSEKAVNKAAEKLRRAQGRVIEKEKEKSFTIGDEPVGAV